MMRLRRGAVVLTAMLAVAPLLGPFNSAGAATGLGQGWSANISSHGAVSAGTRANSAAEVGPKQYYLALGDSLAFGFQPKFQYSHGYADDFFANLKPLGTQKLVDMGCPAEMVQTFLNGHCPLKILTHLKTYYKGPQFAAALSFIKQHAGQVSPVTIDLGANDFLSLLDPATCSVLTNTQGIAAEEAIFDTNYVNILTQLKAALNGTGDLFTMDYYFPYQNSCPNLLPLIQELNTHLAMDAQQAGVPVADVFSAYGGAATPNPHICAWTWMCQQHKVPLICKLLPALCQHKHGGHGGHGTQVGTQALPLATRTDASPPPSPPTFNENIHPNNAGYSVIASTFEQLAGY